MTKIQRFQRKRAKQRKTETRNHAKLDSRFRGNDKGDRNNKGANDKGATFGKFCVVSRSSFALFGASRRDDGFTLVELLVVIGIIVILASVVFIAINPSDRLQKARDDQRKINVNNLYSVLRSYKSREGNLPACVGTIEGDIYDCTGALVPDYIVSLPEDPSSSCAYNTGYFVKKNASIETFGVKAMCAEGEEEIIVGSW
ncbi:MAG: prepilin-type N-terminal cleavage/methylation domain-containing protein [Patescibacteria group bacterium]|nr:prepilin-type N-terminal cleavage/methylation domain-containing protein [Patescibacteria group bacterium]